MLGEEFPEVLRAALAGDEHAFSRLYRDAQPPLLRYLGVLSPLYAEDAASETWLELARSRTPFDGPELAFRAWLFSVARHKVIDRVRYESRRPSSPTDDLEPFASLAPDAADAVIEGDSTARAVALVRTLPQDQAEAVLLRVMVGLEYAEIADVMDRSTGAVRVLVHRGLRRLQREASPVQTDGVTT
jgi:RNA polymerase sigma-70 factor, ECF subfamily